jgi:hypothetical protein
VAKAAMGIAVIQMSNLYGGWKSVFMGFASSHLDTLPDR